MNNPVPVPSYVHQNCRTLIFLQGVFDNSCGRPIIAQPSNLRRKTLRKKRETHLKIRNKLVFEFCIVFIRGRNWKLKKSFEFQENSLGNIIAKDFNSWKLFYYTYQNDHFLVPGYFYFFWLQAIFNDIIILIISSIKPNQNTTSDFQRLNITRK